MEACSLGFEDAINNIKRLPQHKIFAEELTKIYLNNLEDLKHHSQAKPKPGC